MPSDSKAAGFPLSYPLTPHLPAPGVADTVALVEETLVEALVEALGEETLVEGALVEDALVEALVDALVEEGLADGLPERQDLS